MPLRYILKIEISCSICGRRETWTSMLPPEKVEDLFYWKSLLLKGTKMKEDKEGIFTCLKCEAKSAKEKETVSKDTPIKQPPRTKTDPRPLLDICNDHPLYKGVRKPRTDCKDCWDIYYSNHTEETEKLEPKQVKT